VNRTPATTDTSSDACSTVVSADRAGVRLEVIGELDVASWPSVEGAVLACMAVDCDEVVLDLRAVSFVSASACRQLDAAVGAVLATGRRVTVHRSRALDRVAELLAGVGGAQPSVTG
jgi:anti-anti-sigma factor